MIKLAYTQVGMVIGEEKAGRFINPRLIQVVKADAAGVQFNLVQLFGMPEVLDLHEGALVHEVRDRSVIDAYKRSSGGIVVPDVVTDIKSFMRKN